MTEILFIISHLFIMYIFLSLNLEDVISKKKIIYSFFNQQNLFINIILFLNIILLSSFFNLRLTEIIFVYIVYLLILILIIFIKRKNILFNKIEILYPILLFFSCFVIYLELGNNLVIGWDAKEFWIYKTINFYNNDPIANLKNFPNSWYPHLGSLVWSFFWKLSVLDYEYFGRFFYVFIYISSILLILSNLDTTAFYKSILFFAIIIISYDYTYFVDWSVFSGYQEILIFSFVTSACHFLFKIFDNPKNLNYKYLLYLLLICNLLIWTKQEGYVISTSIILTLIIFGNISLRLKFSIVFLFIAIILLKEFIFELYELNPYNIQHKSFMNFSINSMINNISVEKIIIVTKFIFLNLMTNYLILLSMLIIIFQVICNQLEKLKIFLFLIFFNVLSFEAIYLMINNDSQLLMHTIKTSMDRAVFQFAPFTFFIFIEFMKKNNFKI